MVKALKHLYQDIRTIYRLLRFCPRTPLVSLNMCTHTQGYRLLFYEGLLRWMFVSQYNQVPEGCIASSSLPGSSGVLFATLRREAVPWVLPRRPTRSAGVAWGKWTIQAQFMSSLLYLNTDIRVVASEPPFHPPAPPAFRPALPERCVVKRNAPSVTATPPHQYPSAPPSATLFLLSVHI